MSAAGDIRSLMWKFDLFELYKDARQYKLLKSWLDLYTHDFYEPDDTFRFNKYAATPIYNFTGIRHHHGNIMDGIWDCHLVGITNRYTATRGDSAIVADLRDIAPINY